MAHHVFYSLMTHCALLVKGQHQLFNHLHGHLAFDAIGPAICMLFGGYPEEDEELCDRDQWLQWHLTGSMEPLLMPFANVPDSWDFPCGQDSETEQRMRDHDSFPIFYCLASMNCCCMPPSCMILSTADLNLKSPPRLQQDHLESKRQDAAFR